MTARQQPTWYVLGVGSMGQLWAALLHRAGRPVCLLLRTQARLDEYRQAAGISLHDERGEERLMPQAFVTYAALPVTRLLVATKAHQTMDALAPFEGQLRGEVAIALLQNGMGVAEEVLESFPHALVYCLVTTDAAWRDAPFKVHRAGHGRTVVGRHGREAGGEDVLEVVRSLTVPGLNVEISPDIRAAQWRKLAVNSVVNPLTARFGIRNGEVLTDPRARAMIGPLCAELAEVSTAEQVAATAQDLREHVEATCRTTAANHNSMDQDVRNGRPTEIDYITGYVLARAAVHDISCPVNESLYDDIKRRETSVPSP